MVRLRPILSMAFVLAFASLTPALAQQGPPRQTFCVAGRSNDIGWSWGIISNGVVHARAVVRPLPEGAGCDEFASAFVNSINGVISNCVATIRASNPCCFTILCSNGFNFWIGDANGNPQGPQCKVTDNPHGCAFNPMIFYTANPAVVTP